MAHRTIAPPELRPAPTAEPGWRSVLADRRRLAALVGAVALVLAGGWWLLRPAAPPTEAIVPVASDGTSAGSAASAGTASGGGGGASDDAAAGEPTSTPPTTVPDLVVQAAGAVRSPGLYRLDPGARVDDLIRAAGGLTERADRDRINLAAPLVDGQRVWLPVRGQEEVPEVVTGAPPASASAGAGAGAGSGPGDGASSSSVPVDLNAADADALDALPGVGPATAQAILTYREESGPFGSVDELLEVPGIGEAKLEQIRPLVVVG